MTIGAFTPLGEPELEAHIARDLARIVDVVTAAMGSRLRTLLLGGGYGRGEGGGLRDANGVWRPYNDYDLFAIVGGVPRWRLPKLRTELQEFAQQLEAELGVEVELAPLRQEDLSHLPNTMMWCELLGAPRVLAGDAAVLADAPRLAPAELPLVEGVRYLTNRGALLLWAQAEDMPDERRWKFVQKAWLAVGAALLIARHEFRVGYGARHEALQRLQPVTVESVPRLIERHGDAVEARVRPRPAPAPMVVAERLGESVEALLSAWRYLEGVRLQTSLSTWDEYAVRPGLFAERWMSVPLLSINSVRIRGVRALNIVTIREHPRTLVSRVLPSLLASREVSPEVRALLHSAANWQSAAESCLALWRRAN